SPPRGTTSGRERPDFDNRRGGATVATSLCPHCGTSLPIVEDAFCPACREPLDEPPEHPVGPDERAQVQAADRQRVLLVFVAVVPAVKLVGVLLYFILR